MFDRFGEFDSAEEINETAVNLRREGDREGLLVLAEENGIDREIAEAFLSGDLLYLCDGMAAAIGKIDAEERELQPVEILQDWTEYIKARCFEDPETAAAVRRRGKSLKGCIGALLTWSFKHQVPIEKELLKAAGVTASKCTLGIPGMGTAKRIITEYYLGRKQP